MDSTKRKTYNRDFKRRTVDLADNSDRSDRAIEKAMGLYQGAIGHWRKELKSCVFRGNASTDSKGIRPSVPKLSVQFLVSLTEN